MNKRVYAFTLVICLSLTSISNIGSATEPRPYTQILTNVQPSTTLTTILTTLTTH